MNESKQTKSRNITFRLTNEQYEQVENAALAAGEEPNSWCRKVALNQSTEGFGLTKELWIFIFTIYATRRPRESEMLVWMRSS